MIRRPPRSTQSRSSAASDVYKRQQVRGQTGADQPAGAADRHPEPRTVRPHGVTLEVVARARVYKRQEALELLAGRSCTDGIGEAPGRQAVFDVVQQFAGAVVDAGQETMRVLPRGEGPLYLTVDELPALHIAAHLGHPALADGADVGLEDHAAAVPHASLLLQDAESLPRRRQALECSRAGMIREQLVDRHRHDAAPLEDRHGFPPSIDARVLPGGGTGITLQDSLRRQTEEGPR